MPVRTEGDQPEASGSPVEEEEQRAAKAGEPVEELGPQLDRLLEQSGRAFVRSAPMDVRLSENDVVQPDVLIIGREHASRITPNVVDGPPDLGVEILEPHVVQASLAVNRSRSPVADVGTGDILQLDRNVLHDVSEPGPLVLVQATHESAWLTIGTAVFVQPGHVIEQRLDE